MLSHLHATMTFNQLSASLISESHRCDYRNMQLGDEEALAPTFARQASFLLRGYEDHGSQGEK